MLTRRKKLRRSGFMKRGSVLHHISQRRKNKLNEYYSKRKRFLSAHPWCELAPMLFGRQIPSRDVHHRLGRLGTNYLDENTWMALSRESHDWVHNHPSHARARGWIG